MCEVLTPPSGSIPVRTDVSADIHRINPWGLTYSPAECPYLPWDRPSVGTIKKSSRPRGSCRPRNRSVKGDRLHWRIITTPSRRFIVQGIEKLSNRKLSVRRIIIKKSPDCSGSILYTVV